MDYLKGENIFHNMILLKLSLQSFMLLEYYVTNPETLKPLPQHAT